MRKSRFTEQQIIGFLKKAESGLPVIRLLIGGEVSLAQACQQHGLDLDYMRKRIDIGLALLTEMLSEWVSEPVEKVGRWPAGQCAPERL